jgi:hypothetical protein
VGHDQDANSLAAILGSCFADMLVPMLLHNPPIHDYLHEGVQGESAPQTFSFVFWLRDKYDVVLAGSRKRC